jgi:hypothetical protein
MVFMKLADRRLFSSGLAGFVAMAVSNFSTAAFSETVLTILEGSPPTAVAART